MPGQLLKSLGNMHLISGFDKLKRCELRAWGTLLLEEAGEKWNKAPKSW
jgi:hypothetical protein